MAKQRKAPKWCYWRKDILWLRITVDGREVRESLRTSSYDVAAELARAARTRLLGASRGKTVHTWEDAVSGWSAHIPDAVSTRTALRYVQSIKIVSPWFAGKDIAEIGKAEIGAMVAGRQKRDGKKKGTSNATIRRDLTAVASVLDYADDQDWREGNPARDRSRRIKEARKPITLPPMADIEAVLTRFEGGLAGIARFALLSGMRLNEIVSIDRRHLDARAGTLYVAFGKGNRERTISLVPEAVSVLARQPVSMVSSLAFHHNGERYSCVSTNFARVVAAAQKAAHDDKRDFTRFRFHDLRHVFAVETLRTGRMGLYELSKHLGHSSVMTTERHYLRYLTPEQAKLAKEMKDGTFGDTRAAVSSVPKTA